MTARPVPAWPLIVLALPAAVSIWAGWVGLGGLTGFGEVQLLPGIWDSLRVNTAITLPIGMEAYAAYALRAWLTRGTPPRARQFAKASAISALVLGTLGQIAYHLMAAAGVTAAPWLVTMLVSCLPVAVLGMGAALYHLLDDQPQPDAPARPAPAAAPFSPPGAAPAGRPDEQSAGRPADQRMDRPGPATRTTPPRRPRSPGEVRKRTGARKTDGQLAAAVREMAARNGGRPPSQYRVRRSLGVGGPRAARLVAELATTTATTTTRKEDSH